MAPGSSRQKMNDGFCGLERPAVVNVVAAVNLGVKVDLKKLALHTRNSAYQPKRFCAVILRIREPAKATASVFASGKLICTGTRSEEHAVLAAQKFAGIINKVQGTEITVTSADVIITNIVASCYCGFSLRIDMMFQTYYPKLGEDYCWLNKELFPGLRFRIQVPKATFLLFDSGKIVINGVKRTADIYTAYINMYPVLLQFCKGITNAQSTNINQQVQMMLGNAPLPSSDDVAATAAAAANEEGVGPSRQEQEPEPQQHDDDLLPYLPPLTP